MLPVTALIESIGKPFDLLLAEQLVPENKKLKSRYSGGDERHIDMPREGVDLDFERESKRLLSVVLTLRNDDKPNYVFPNVLPKPLIQNMTLQWVHQTIGGPVYAIEPVRVAGVWQGVVEQYNLLKSVYGSISMLIIYNLNKEAKEVFFMPEKNVFFHSRDGEHSE